MFDAIDVHRQRGILFIAAAGNSALDNDTALFYPATYNLPNIIAVAATTRTDGLAWFSNVGRHTVHLGAPGESILSTTPANTYSTFSGTSMATPHVTGVAALLKAQDPARDWREIKNLLLAGGDNNTSLTDTITQKRLNAYGALTCASSILLSRLQPTQTTVTGSVGTTIDLAVLHINCASPNGGVTVTVDPGGQTITLLDDGFGSDQATGDGIYSGQWTPQGAGTFTLTFPGGDVVTVSVLSSYTVSSTPVNYRTISGTNLNLDDDSSAQITSPFPIRFGGGSFTDLFVSSNGNLNFTGVFSEFSNAPIPSSLISNLVAPFWDDLYALPGTNQNVFWQAMGTAPNRELVIEWRDVRHFMCYTTSTATVKFQVVFFEGTSDILFNYADTAVGGGCTGADQGGSATVGVQVSSGAGTQFSFNTQNVNDNMALLWTLQPPPSPTLSATPISQDFGNVRVGRFADRTFTVRNTGAGTLTGSASATTPFSIVSGNPFSLGAGASQAVMVRFTPTSMATFAGSVSLASNGGDISRGVTGTGTASDLTGTWLNPGPTQGCKGEGQKLRCTLKGQVEIRNEGNAKAPTASLLKFYLSADQTLDGSDTFLKQVAVGALRPGQVQRKRLSVRLPTGQNASEKYVLAVIDATDRIVEAEKSNNLLPFGPLP